MHIAKMQLMHRLLALCRGYVEDAVEGAFDLLGLPGLIEAGESLEQISEKIGSTPQTIGRLLYAAATLRLVELRADGAWIRTSVPKREPRPWRDLHRLFSEEAILKRFVEAPESAAAAETIHALRSIGVLEPDERGSALSEAAKPFFDSRSRFFVGPLVQSYALNSAPGINPAAIAAAVSSRWPSSLDKPFSAAGWDQGRLESFMIAMHRTSAAEAPALFSQLKPPSAPYSVLDVGGGLGTAAAGFLAFADRPKRICVYDRSTSVALFERLARTESELGDQIEFVGGDFFEESASGGLVGLPSDAAFDFILLGWILHDWTDARALEIVRRTVQHLAPNGVLCVLESILPDSRLGPVAMLDMTMLVQTEGRERTESEYEALMERAGLRRSRTICAGGRRQMMTFERIAHS